MDSKASRHVAKTYVLADVMRLTGAKRPQIEYWVRKGLIRGEFEQGTGLPRQFVFRNLVEIALAVDLTVLGIGTDVMSSIIDNLRSGDIETDVRTPWFVEMTSGPPVKLPKLSKKTNAEMRAAMDSTPLEERCCAEVNDDGTLKLLKLLRAYVDAGVSDAEARKALLAVAKEHISDLRRWDKERDAFHRRWRRFKNPQTRPSASQFWLISTLEASEEDQSRWARTKLTDFRDPDDRSAHAPMIAVPLRPLLERLEQATSDSWRATPEKSVFHVPEAKVSARQLVDQAFNEYERTEHIKELRALGKLPSPNEHVHAHG